MPRRRDERGATAVEYSFIVAFIAAVIFGTIVLLGLNVAGCFDAFRDAFEDALPG